MSPFWFLLCTIKLVTANIFSFGIETANGSNAIIANPVNLRLVWKLESWECAIYPNLPSTTYTCYTNSTSTKLATPNHSHRNQYYVQINSNNTDTVWISSIFLTDANNNQYKINHFCVSAQFVFLTQSIYQSSANPCNVFNNIEVPDSYDIVGINKIVPLNIHIMSNKLNQIKSGYITSPNVATFGIKTGSDGSSGANEDVELTLYWNLEVIQCKIRPISSNNEYICSVNESIVAACFRDEYGYDNTYKLHIDNNNADALEIESLVVNDETGHYYGIDNFCIHTNASDSGKSRLANNCSSSYNLYARICVDNANCNNPFIDISFGDALFEHSNTYNNYGVVESGVAESQLTCSPTASPTNVPSNNPSSTPSSFPTANPSMLPTIDPTTEPTQYPSQTPTKGPTYVPTLYPSVSPTIAAEYSYDGNYILIDAGIISWIDANEYCLNRFNTYLATISHGIYNQEAAYLVNAKSPTKTAYFGLNEFYSTNSWNYIGHGSVCGNPCYTNWASASVRGTDQCSLIDTTGKWYTTACTVKQNVSILCNTYSRVIKNTPSGRFIYHYLGRISWAHANQYCVDNYGTTLATITTKEQNEEISVFGMTEYHNYPIIIYWNTWIGLTAHGGTQWSWIDDTSMNYTNWVPGLSYDPSQSCGYLSAMYGWWYDYYCDSTADRPFLCNAHIKLTTSKTYKLILQLNDVLVGTFSPSIKTTGNENENYPSQNTYSIIGNLDVESYRGPDGKFEFKLVYGSCNQLSHTTIIWKQSSWLTSNNITGLEHIAIPEQSVGLSPTEVFLGLGSSGSVESSYLDGNAELYAEWWNSVGTISTIGNTCQGQPGIPGFNKEVVRSEWLYIVTYDPTNEPTQDPSNNPTSTPSISPTTMAPTYPTQSPTIFKHLFSDNYIYIYSTTSPHITWSYANEYCLNTYGTSLAIINSSLQNTEIADLLSLTGPIGAPGCGYIGLTKLQNQDDWVWTDGLKRNYTNWGNSSLSWRCAVICQTGLWDVRDCAQIYWVATICNSPITKKPTSNPTKEPTINPTKITKHPTGNPTEVPTTTPTHNPTTKTPTKPTVSPTILTATTLHYNFHYIYLGKAINWFEANEHCIDNFGTFLATISSPKYNGEAAYSVNIQYIKHTAGLYAFIGLNNLHDSTSWGWIDNTKLNYSNWHDINESLSKMKGCTYMNKYGTWYSTECQSKCIDCAILCNVLKTNQPSASPTWKPIASSSAAPTDQIATGSSSTNPTISLTVEIIVKSSINETTEKQISTDSITETSSATNSVYILLVILCILVFMVLVVIIAVYFCWKRNRVNDAASEKTHIQMQEIIEEVLAIKRTNDHLTTPKFVDGTEDEKNETEPLQEEEEESD